MPGEAGRPPLPPPPPPPRTAALDLEGRWTAACHRLDNGAFVKETYDFLPGRAFALEQARYDDQDCSRENLLEAKTYTGDYRILGPAPEVSPQAAKIDFTVGHVFRAALSDETARTFTDAHLCALRAWQVGERREITGILCNGERLPAATVIQDLVQQDGDRLYFGDESYFHDWAFRQKRPAHIEMDVPFTQDNRLSH